MINIAEILKDCPKGIELYSPLCGKCVFDRLNMGTTIVCKKQNTQEITFTREGYYMLPVFDDCECMIFPSKDQRDWSKFQRPFKDGDIVATTNGLWIGITTGGYSGCSIPTYCIIHCDERFEAYFNYKEKWKFARLANEDEKQRLFDAIKANGYHWNAETKTLEKLVVPKFKVGDRIRSVISLSYYTIIGIEDDQYVIQPDEPEKFPYHIDFGLEINYELVSKFDINTLIPFESKVLVRDENIDEWRGHFFSHYDSNSDRPYVCIGVEGITEYKQCIPYKGNEHLLGKTDECDGFYETWQ